MNYKEYNFKLKGHQDFHRDLLVDALSGIGFDTFEDTELGFKGYIPEEKDIDDQLSSIADQYEGMFSFAYDVLLIPHQNWNEVWESNFEPLLIDNMCYVRATFHEAHPEYPFEIVIDPKMAFGTGHHQTTSLMIRLMMGIDVKGRNVLDMGCGTGILAILASLMGAKEIVAIDYDRICFESTIENASLNRVPNILPRCGSKEIIPDEQFEIILANINRNILLDQIERYSEVLATGGILLLSGFYQDPDLEIIRTEAARCGLKYISHEVRDHWVAAMFQA